MNDGKALEMTIIAIIVITLVGVIAILNINYNSNNKACEAAGGVYVKFRHGYNCMNPNIFIKVK